jgi:hypothetical protein
LISQPFEIKMHVCFIVKIDIHVHFCSTCYTIMYSEAPEYLGLSACMLTMVSLALTKRSYHIRGPLTIRWHDTLEFVHDRESIMTYVSSDTLTAAAASEHSCLILARHHRWLLCNERCKMELEIKGLNEFPVDTYVDMCVKIMSGPRETE